MGNQPSQPKITAQDKAIFQLKQQRDKLKQYQRKLSVTVDRQKQLAKEALTKNNPAKAKVYLKSKKQQESIIAKTYDQLDNLENLIGTIEFKLIEKDVMYGLQQGNQVLSKLNSEMSVDRIDKIMDDLEDNRLQVDEVSDMLGIGGLSYKEDDEVEEEFNRLNEEVNGKVSLPSAPKNEIQEFPEAPVEEPRNPQKEPGESKEEENSYEPINA